MTVNDSEMSVKWKRQDNKSDDNATPIKYVIVNKWVAEVSTRKTRNCCLTISQSD